MRFNKYSILVCFAAINIWSAEIHAQTQARPSFEVEHRPANKNDGPAVSIKFEGIRHSPPVVLKAANDFKLTVSATKNEKFVQALFLSQRSSEPTAYAAMWERSRRAYVLDTFKSQPKLWQDLRAEIGNLDSVELNGDIKYGAYDIIWVTLVSKNGSKTAKVLPLKLEDGISVLTNDLSRDLLFGQLLILLKN